MVWWRQRILGLVIQEGVILAAEVALTGRRAVLVRAAGLPVALAPGLSPEEVQQAGRALRDLLRASGFSGRRAVVAVPASWLLVARKRFPPAPLHSLAPMARIEAERSFATGIAELIVDCTASATTERSPDVLLAAIPRGIADQLRAVVLAAGLRLRALTCTPVALASVPGLPESSMVLLLSPQQAEVTTRAGDRVTDLRHARVRSLVPGQAKPPGTGEWLPAVAGLVGRAAALSPPPDAEGGPEVVVWDTLGLDPEALARIREAAGLPVRVAPRLADVGISGAPEGPAAIAAVVAVLGARRGALAVDFAHPRLAMRRPRRSWRRVAWVTAVCLALVGAGLSLSAQWRADQEQVSSLRQRLRELQPEIQAAETMVDQAALARRWTACDPRFLDALRDLTLVFPRESAIWATSLVVQDDMRVLISGKSESEQPVLTLLEQVRGRPAFANARLLYLRQTGAGKRELAFALACEYAGGGRR